MHNYLVLHAYNVKYSFTFVLPKGFTLGAKLSQMKNQIASSVLFTTSFFSLIVSCAAMPIGGLNHYSLNYSPNIANWIAYSLCALFLSALYFGIVLNSDINK